MASAIKDTTFPGTISYNGFVFGGTNSTPPTYELQSTLIYDDAERTVTHVNYKLEILTLVYANSENSASSQISQLRSDLSRPGRKLVIQDIGFGDTTVQQGESHPDIIWGVKPRVLEFSPVGGMLAWQLVWQCEFNVSESSASTPSSGDWIAFNYQMSYQIDEQGFTTRTVDGYVHIAQIRGTDGDPATRQSSDQVRDRLTISVPNGFQRTSSQWTESQDKARLDFVIVDDEIRTDPFPPGIVAAEVDYQLQSHDIGFARLTASLSGMMETAPDIPKSIALMRLLLIAKDKMQKLQAGVTASGGGLVVPSRISTGHKLFSRQTTLNVEFQAVQCLPSLLAYSGMWDPVVGSNYQLWKSSVAHLWRNRGRANLRSKPSEAVIVDLLDNPTKQTTIGNSNPNPQVRYLHLHPVSLVPKVTSEASWLSYQVRIRAVRKENSSIHSLAQGIQSSGTNSSSNPGIGSPFRTTNGESGRVLEVHGEPIQQIEFEGEAVRLKYLPIVPVLRSVGGRQVLERHRTEEQEQITHFCGVPAYQMRWRIIYDVEGYVRRHDPPSNPVMGDSSSSNTEL